MPCSLSSDFNGSQFERHIVAPVNFSSSLVSHFFMSSLLNASFLECLACAYGECGYVGVYLRPGFISIPQKNTPAFI